MQPTWPKKSRNRLTGFRCYRLGPVLAYSLQREGSTSRGRERLFEVISTLPHGASVLLCFGEIDCRAQLSKQAAKQNRPIEEIVDECVAAYLSVGREIALLGFDVAYWQVPPPTLMVGDQWEFPAVGTYEERLEITCRFNSSLSALAKTEGHKWISIFETLTNNENRPQPHFFLDGVHLSQHAMPATIMVVKENFSEIDFS